MERGPRLTNRGRDNRGEESYAVIAGDCRVLNSTSDPWRLQVVFPTMRTIAANGAIFPFCVVSDDTCSSCPSADLVPYCMLPAIRELANLRFIKLSALHSAPPRVRHRNPFAVRDPGDSRPLDREFVRISSFLVSSRWMVYRFCLDGLGMDRIGDSDVCS